MHIIQKQKFIGNLFYGLEHHSFPMDNIYVVTKPMVTKVSQYGNGSIVLLHV